LAVSDEDTVTDMSVCVPQPRLLPQPGLLLTFIFYSSLRVRRQSHSVVQSQCSCN